MIAVSAGLRLMRLGASHIAGMRPTYVKALYRSVRAEIRMRRWWMISAIAARHCFLQRWRSRRLAAGRPVDIQPRQLILRCGTGLAARAFSAVVDEIIGIDLSPRMIERARATGLYAELEVAEIVEGLGGRPDGTPI